MVLSDSMQLNNSLYAKTYTKNSYSKQTVIESKKKFLNEFETEKTSQGRKERDQFHL